MCFYKSNGITKSVSFPFPGTLDRVVRGPARPAVQLLLSTPRKGYHLHRLRVTAALGTLGHSLCAEEVLVSLS